MRSQIKREKEREREKTRVNFPMDLVLSSRIKAIFTKVFCTFFTPFSPPSIRGHLPAYRGVAAIDEVPRTDPYETAIDSDIFIK